MASAKKELLEVANRRRAEVEVAKADLQRKLKALTEEADALDLLRQRYGAMPSKAASQMALIPTAPHGNDRKPNPTEAIMAAVRAEPGIKTLDIVNRLDGKIETKSSKPRRMIASMVDVLIRRGANPKLRKDSEGRVYLREARA